MAVEEVGVNSAISDIESLTTRESINCPIDEEEKHHLFHQVGLISRFFRDRFIFPLMAATDTVSQKILNREDWISRDLFWNSSFSDIRYPKHQQIKDAFDRFDQYIVINENGKEIKLKCRIIESKGCPKDSKEGVLNHIIIHGNLSTLDNNMPGLYPFLSSYIKNKEENPEILPARFIILTHYDHILRDEGSLKEEIYLPGDMDEWTFVFKKALESIVDEYGTLEMISAHSLGNIPVIGHLKHVKNEEFTRLFPKTLFLSQGPSSVYQVTKNISFDGYTRGFNAIFGTIAYYIAKWTGWEIALDEILVDRLSQLPNQEKFNKKLNEGQIVITEVAHDHYFPGKASLCDSDKFENIDQRVNLYRLSFNPPLSWSDLRGHHNFNMGLMQRQDLIRERLHLQGRRTVHLDNPREIIDYEVNHPLIIRHEESLVDAVLRPLWERVSYKQGISLEGRVLPIAVGG